jgi:hypothetical protein
MDTPKTLQLLSFLLITYWRTLPWWSRKYKIIPEKLTDPGSLQVLQLAASVCWESIPAQRRLSHSRFYAAMHRQELDWYPQQQVLNPIQIRTRVKPSLVALETGLLHSALVVPSTLYGIRWSVISRFSSTACLAAIARKTHAAGIDRQGIIALFLELNVCVA